MLDAHSCGLHPGSNKVWVRIHLQITSYLILSHHIASLISLSSLLIWLDQCTFLRCKRDPGPLRPRTCHAPRVQNMSSGPWAVSSGAASPSRQLPRRLGSPLSHKGQGAGQGAAKRNSKGPACLCVVIRDHSGFTPAHTAHRAPSQSTPRAAF